jgi:histidinol dehydrogenase
LEIIEGFAAASARLSRRTVSGAGGISPRMRSRLKEIFGADIGLEEAVARILDDVRNQGDQAVLDYTFRIDGFRLKTIEIKPAQIREAYSQTDKELVEALTIAAGRIRSFHEAQKEHLFQEVNGADWDQLVRPLFRVGVYAPGGTASYPSTVLMTAIPARVAGVKEVILATPPRNDGAIPPATLVAADIAGVD